GSRERALHAFGCHKRGLGLLKPSRRPQAFAVCPKTTARQLRTRLGSAYPTGSAPNLGSFGGLPPGDMTVAPAPPCDPLRVAGEHVRKMGVARESPFSDRSALHPHLRSPFGILKQPRRLLRPAFGLLGRQEETCLLTGEDLARAADVRRDHRRLHRHRLDHDPPERLL